jgi:hypothetical protein
MIIDRNEAQECYTQHESNFNGLFTANQKIDGIYEISCGAVVSYLIFDEMAACRGSGRLGSPYRTAEQFPTKKARLTPALPLVRPKQRKEELWVGRFRR